MSRSQAGREAPKTKVALMGGVTQLGWVPVPGGRPFPDAPLLAALAAPVLWDEEGNCL